MQRPSTHGGGVRAEGHEHIVAACKAATDQAGRGAVLVDGEMIDEASCRIARALVARGRQAHQEEGE